MRRAGDGALERGVEGGVLGRAQRPPEGRFGQRAQQGALSLRRLYLPGGIVHAGRPRALIERVEPGAERATEFDDPAADGTTHDGPLAFGIPGHVDLAPEGNRARGQAFGQHRLALADDTGQELVRVGQHPLFVEGPRVIDEGGGGPRVRSDEHPVAAQTRLGQERVRPAQHVGGRPVRLDPAACGRSGAPEGRSHPLGAGRRRRAARPWPHRFPSALPRARPCAPPPRPLAPAFVGDGDPFEPGPPG